MQRSARRDKLNLLQARMYAQYLWQVCFTFQLEGARKIVVIIIIMVVKVVTVITK